MAYLGEISPLLLVLKSNITTKNITTFFRFQEDQRVIAAPLGKRISPMAETNQKTENPLLVSAALEQSQDAIEHIDCSDTEQRLTMDFLFSSVSFVS